MTGARERKNFTGCMEGAAAIEFAIIANLLFLLIFALIELGILFFVRAVLEVTGYAGSVISDEAYIDGEHRKDLIREKVQELASGLINVNDNDGNAPDFWIDDPEIYADGIPSPSEPCLVTPPCPFPGIPQITFVDVNGNKQWDEFPDTSGYGGIGDIQLYTINYTWPIIAPPLQVFFGTSITLTTKVMLLNEPLN